jgi:hypothetical protein
MQSLVDCRLYETMRSLWGDHVRYTTLLIQASLDGRMWVVDALYHRLRDVNQEQIGALFDKTARERRVSGVDGAALTQLLKEHIDGAVDLVHHLSTVDDIFPSNLTHEAKRSRLKNVLTEIVPGGMFTRTPYRTVNPTFDSRARLHRVWKLYNNAEKIVQLLRKFTPASLDSLLRKALYQHIDLIIVEAFDYYGKAAPELIRSLDNSQHHIGNLSDWLTSLLIPDEPSESGQISAKAEWKSGVNVD